MPKLQPIQQPMALAAIAHDAIRRSIITGKMKPGMIYNEVPLAKELNISRTPVREALLELAAKGLINFLPRKGVEVVRFSRGDIEEIFEVRLAMELFIVEKAARQREKIDLSSVDAAMQEQEIALDKDDMIGFMDGDRSFHYAFAELSGNERMNVIMTNLRDLVHIMGLEALATRGRAMEVISEHRLVYQAIVNGDVRAARRNINRHLDLSREAVLQRSRYWR